MKHLFCAAAVLFACTSFAQTTRIKPDKYPSLLWEVKSPKSSKPSYLFGTMHVSSKMVFHLSDSFYLGIRNAQVVALETNPGTWQEDFSRYNLDGESMFANSIRYGGYSRGGDGYLTINSFKLKPYEKSLEAALYTSPSMINSFLYRSNSEMGSDFEEDTYLDLHIFQAGKKLGKKVCGVEDFDGSMKLVKEAYADAAKEKARRERRYDYDEELSYGRLDEAYRTGNLDLLDTINKINSQSAAFDEKFLYKRNEIQANSIDSILKTGQTLFVGVGAAHLPGERGVIEMLRRAGYRLRPIKMSERDSHHKDAIEKMRVPVQFSKQTAEDGFYNVSTPGKLYRFGKQYGKVDMQQYADMINGSYYMVTRILTNAPILSQTQQQVERKVDSVLYENIPGRILTRKPIVRNGYRGFDITARTRRGDHQRYNIYVTPFEVIVFKMSGNGDYIQLGKEAEQFFGSVQMKEFRPAASSWQKWSPVQGGFTVQFPHEPLAYVQDEAQYTAYEPSTATGFAVLRTDVHNYGFVEEDSFDLNLMDESFASSEAVDKLQSRKWTKVNGYPALDATYKYKDGSTAMVRYVVKGPHYYALVANAKTPNKSMQAFINSFGIQPLTYAKAKTETDTALKYTVQSPVPLQKKQKMDMYPQEAYYGGSNGGDDDSLIDNGKWLDRVVVADSTGEQIQVSYYRPSVYAYQPKEQEDDSVEFKKEWTIRHQANDTLPDGTTVSYYEVGNPKSSRALLTKTITKKGATYSLEAQVDTLSAPSAFIQSFFQSFSAQDTAKGVDVKQKKTGLFFAQFFSTDTLKHKTAVKNLQYVEMDSSDLPQLKKAVATLSWREKKYLDVKKELVGKLATITVPEASEYLKTMYFAAGDTVELQYAALETLLQQQTTYAYKVFADIVSTDPPVLNVDQSSGADYSMGGGYSRYRYNDYDYGSKRSYANGNFMDNLYDTLQLTSGIYKSIQPLISVNDYEEPMMQLTGALIDSGRIKAQDYETFLPKFLIEARQTLKKQLIQEKAQAIEKAQIEEEDRAGQYDDSRGDYGNAKLTLYTSLLMPYWDRNPQVAPLINALLTSNDERLKYNTAMQMARAGRSIPDTMLKHFAAKDEFRYELYDDLKRAKRLELFPKAYNSQEAIARSQAFGSETYNKPDTIALLSRQAVTHKDREGWVYVFKYKEKKDDQTWRLTTVGLLPKDTAKYSFETPADKRYAEWEYDFSGNNSGKLTTETSEAEQVEKLMKKLRYSKRKSAVRFYQEENQYDGMDDMVRPRY